MTDYDEFDDDFDDDALENESDETPEDAVERLRAEIAEGDTECRPELAEALMQSARNAVEGEHYEDALDLVDEALAIGNEMLEDGEIEFGTSIGRCLLFRAAVIRLYQGSEAALIAFNEAIRYFAEHVEIDDPISRNELAVALVNKADLLIDPLGAHSAAIAAQEQAIRIWGQLVDDGQPQFRRQLSAVLLSCGDAKLQSGDPEKAMQDYRKSVQVAREGLEEEGNDFRGLVIQGLMKQSRVYEQVGDSQHAFEVSSETIRLAEELVDGDGPEAALMLTPLYLQHGLLFEKIGDSRSALELFDRCRDVYQRVLEGEPLEEPGDYIVRTGLANIVMCRGNMLADLRCYDEAAEAFDESVRLYREAEPFRPEDDDDDDTFIPYSIAVVRLNHANMLASQQKLDEAVAMKEESLEALRRRYEKGHVEILPNLISAYRKMVGIHRVRDDVKKTAHWLDELVRIIDSAVDDGHLEYRSDLGVAYHMRSVFHEEQGNPAGEPEENPAGNLAEAEKDLLRAVNLFRQIADETSDSQEVQMSKLHWGELLERLALLYARQKRIDDALEMFRKAVDDVQMLYAEGDRHIMFDILLAYTQMLVFIDTVLRENDTEFPESDVTRWGHVGLDAAETALELSRRERIRLGDDLSAGMFFSMKLAFFRQMRGSLYSSMKEYEKAEKEYSLAVDHWKSLLDDLEHLRHRRRYFEKEAGETPADGETEDGQAEDPYQDRYVYYVGELRQAFQRRAHCRLAREESDAAEEDFQADTELAQELRRRGIPDADRYLLLSLTVHARAMEDALPPEKISELYEEARTLILKRFHDGKFVDDDYFMFRHIHVSYALYLLKSERVEQSIELIRRYSEELEAVETFPEPGVWVELCKALEIHAFWHLDGDQVREVYDRQHRFLARHPDFETNAELRNYDASLTAKAENPEPPEKNDGAEKDSPVK